MSEPEVERIARFLATHALLLLGAGMLATVAAVVAILSAARLAGRFRPLVQRSIMKLAGGVQRIDLVRGGIRRVQGVVPSAYLALHLALGLLLTVAIAVFASLAEEALAGRDLAAFDLALARALHGTRTPEWERTFSVVSWLGSRADARACNRRRGRCTALSAADPVGSRMDGRTGGRRTAESHSQDTFERTRPEFADPVPAASSWSFPSGHAMGTFIFCGGGGAICSFETLARGRWRQSW